MKELTHKGLRPDRNQYNFREQIFSEVWEEENKRRAGVNGGWTLLECLLQDPNADSLLRFMKQAIVTQRDADVAATVIQWLGTNCGGSFLWEVERRMNKYERREKFLREKWQSITENHTGVVKEFTTTPRRKLWL